MLILPFSNIPRHYCIYIPNIGLDFVKLLAVCRYSSILWPCAYNNFELLLFADDPNIIVSEKQPYFYQEVQEYILKYPYLSIIIVSCIATLLIIFPAIFLCHRICRKKLVVYRPTPTQVISIEINQFGFTLYYWRNCC